MASERLDFECPECGRAFKATLQDVIHGRTVRCPKSHSVKLVDEGGETRKVEGKLRKLDPKFRL